MQNIYDKKNAYLLAHIKDADLKQGIVTGYFSSFGNVDSDGDIIVRGAYTKTIEDRGPESKQPRIKHLLNHQVDQPIGKLLKLEETEIGLYYESKAGAHTIGKEFIKMVDAGLITEHSIGYRVIKWEKDQDQEGITKLTELQLWEGSSLTGWGANSQTPLTGMKAQDKIDLLAVMQTKQQRVEKFCHNTDISDETIELLLLENKQLSQLIIDLTKATTQAVDKTLEPDNKCADDKLDFEPFKSIYSLLKIPVYEQRRYENITAANT